MTTIAIAKFSYQAILNDAAKISWRVEDLIGSNQQLDFTKPFSPEAIAHTQSISCLTPDEQLTLNHSRFISQDQRFTLCELIASDADSVRTACRQANISFDRIWTATVLEPAPEVMAFSQISANPTVHVLVEVTHHPPLAEKLLESEIPDFHPYFESRHVRWVRSFVSRDRCRAICELEATDVGTVREAYRVAGYSIERVWVVDILESEPETVQTSGVREPV
jgi:hypothetical protein